MEQKGFDELIASAKVTLEDALSKVPDAALRADMNAHSSKLMSIAEDLKMSPEEKNIEITHLSNKFKAKYGA